jgi:hypothetical protein
LAAFRPFLIDVFLAGRGFFVADALTRFEAFFVVLGLLARFLVAVFLLVFFALRAMVCPLGLNPRDETRST